MKFYSVIVGLLMGLTLNAQTSDKLLSELSFYGDAMVNSYRSVNRSYAFDHFEPLLKSVFEQEDGFNISLDSIPGINVLESGDGSFRIVSWQLELDNANKYYAFVQTKNNKYYPFVESNTDLGVDFGYYIHTPDDWYGAVYYDIRKSEAIDGKDTYLIYGFKRLNKFTKVKFVDVLSFDEVGIPQLGMEIFSIPIQGSRDDIHTKLMLSYDADAYVGFKYNEERKMILFDHLISKMGQHPGQGMTKYPDGTYEGYIFDGKQYVYKEKIFDQINTTVPRDRKKKKKSKLFKE